MSFKDHFSRQAAAYSRYRPGYPPELIEFVAHSAPDMRVAVDCATGNGQAAAALAGHFEQVVALDGSMSQLRNARSHPRVRFVAGVAEWLPLADQSVSLVAAAQALHWFDFGRFYAECRRVLVPGGAIAAWTYGLLRVDPEVDSVIDHFYTDVVGDYWPPERRYVEEAYRTLPFPWRESEVPEFRLQVDWDLDDVVGYLETWSAVQRYKDRNGSDPLPAVRRALAQRWTGGPRRGTWPVHLRLGRA